MAHRRLGQFDKATGEILEDGFVAYVVPKKKNGFDRWIAMSQEAMIWLSRQRMSEMAKDIGAEEMRVLFCLLGHLSYENHVITPQSEMSEAIEMKNSNFNRALKKLIERGIVEKGPKVGRIISLKISPDFAWKGSAKNHRKILLDKSISEKGFSVIEGGS